MVVACAGCGLPESVVLGRANRLRRDRLCCDGSGHASLAFGNGVSVESMESCLLSVIGW